MKVTEFNRRIFDNTWTTLNQELAAIEASDGLPAVFSLLQAQQTNIGFIQDDLHQSQLHTFIHPRNESKFFTVQYNPKRAERFNGAGRTTPPKDIESINNGCFLCRENVQWQQCGKELGYDIKTKNGAYSALMNAYPLMPQHAVLVSQTHIPQALPFLNDGEKLESILMDLVELAVRLPGHIGFYNGEGAGASIPGHLHFQFFEKPAGISDFPLEATAKAQTGEPPFIIKSYPVYSAYWKNSPDKIVGQSLRTIKQWIKDTEDKPNLSANIFTSLDSDGDINLYFVPRNQMLSHSQEMTGAIGGLEVLGELVFSSKDEKHRLDQNEIDYHTVERILSAISVPGHINFKESS